MENTFSVKGIEDMVKLAKLMKGVIDTNEVRIRVYRELSEISPRVEPARWLEVCDAHEKADVKFKSAVKKVMKELGVEELVLPWGGKVEADCACYSWAAGYNYLLNNMDYLVPMENRERLSCVYRVCGSARIEEM